MCYILKSDTYLWQTSKSLIVLGLPAVYCVHADMITEVGQALRPCIDMLQVQVRAAAGVTFRFKFQFVTILSCIVFLL
jgi:hypothetical protein